MPRTGPSSCATRRRRRAPACLRATIPSCSCGWLWSGTVDAGLEADEVQHRVGAEQRAGRRRRLDEARMRALRRDVRTAGSIGSDYRCPRDRGRGSAAPAAGVRGRGVGRRRLRRDVPGRQPRHRRVDRRGAADGRRQRRDARSPPPRPRFRPGRRARPATALASCAGSPTSMLEHEDDLARLHGARSRASRSRRRASRSPTRPRSTSGSARRRSASTATRSRRRGRTSGSTSRRSRSA